MVVASVNVDLEMAPMSAKTVDSDAEPVGPPVESSVFVSPQEYIKKFAATPSPIRKFFGWSFTFKAAFSFVCR